MTHSLTSQASNRTTQDETTINPLKSIPKISQRFVASRAWPWGTTTGDHHGLLCQLFISFGPFIEPILFLAHLYNHYNISNAHFIEPGLQTNPTNRIKQTSSSLVWKVNIYIYRMPNLFCFIYLIANWTKHHFFSVWLKEGDGAPFRSDKLQHKHGEPDIWQQSDWSIATLAIIY